MKLEEAAPPTVIVIVRPLSAGLSPPDRSIGEPTVPVVGQLSDTVVVCGGGEVA